MMQRENFQEEPGLFLVRRFSEILENDSLIHFLGIDVKNQLLYSHRPNLSLTHFTEMS